MAKKPLLPRVNTPVRTGSRKHAGQREPVTTQHKLAALAALYSVMMTASKLSQGLMQLTDQVGGSLEEIAEVTGIDFWDVDAAYSAGVDLKDTRSRRRANMVPTKKPRKASKPPR